ncbi:MAG: type II toxin-antitoxin system HicB family antitoxin [Pirellulales bacterium]
MDMIQLVNTNVTQSFDAQWGAPTSYRCHVGLLQDEDGGFSVIVLNLPGCGSCGDTEEEALRNVREAILGVIESHVAAGEEIPWRDSTSDEIPQGARQKWIVVHA